MNNCKYTLELEGKTINFNSYQELVNYVSTNKNILSKDSTNDLIFSEDNKLTKTDALISNIISKVKLETTTVTSFLSEEMIDKAPKGYISLSEYLESAKKEDDTVFFTPLKEEDFVKNTITKLIEEDKLPRVEAVKEANNIVQEWKMIADNAKFFYDVVGSYFNGERTAEGLYGLYKDTVDNPKLYFNIVEGLKDLTYKLHGMFGKDAKIYPNILLNSELNDSEDKLITRIDLLVRDDKGDVHVVKLAPSSKLAGNQIDVKKRKQDYMLGFQRHMLASKGITGLNTSSLIIVPVNMKFDEDALSEVFFQELEDRSKTISNTGGINRLQWGSGEFYYNINKKIPIHLENTEADPKLVGRINEEMNKFFPTRNVDKKTKVLNSDYFIEKHVHDSDDLSKGRWMFKAYNYKGGNKNIYIKESTDKKNNIELKEEVEAYLKQQESNISGKIDSFTKSLRDAIDGKLDLSQVSPLSNSITSSFIEWTFGKYINGSWKLVENAKLASLGIIAIENTSSKQIDIISIAYCGPAMNKKIDLRPGQTHILGSHKKYSELDTDKNILSATPGNIELMRTMLALTEFPDWFNGIFKIGNIKVIDPDYALGSTATLEEIQTSFHKLSNISGVNKSLEKVDFMDQFDIFKEEVNYIVKQNRVNSTSLNAIFADIETIDSSNKMVALQKLNELKTNMERSFPGKLTKISIEKLVGEINNPVVSLYILLLKTIYNYKGLPFNQVENDLGYYSGSIKSGNFLNGTMITNPNTVPSRNLLVMNDILRKATDDIISDVTKASFRFKGDHVQKLWESKNYDYADNGTLGNQHRLYKNLYETIDGKLNKNMIYKNPYDANSKLDNGEREFLKSFLWEINKVRFKLGDDVKESSEQVKELKQNPKWYWVPLMEAQGNSKFVQGNFIQSIKQSVKDVKNALKGFRRNEEGIYDENELAALKRNMDDYTIFNRFQESEREDSRYELLQEYPPEFWEQNAESIFNNYIFAAKRKEHLDKALPYVKMLKLASEIYRLDTGENSESFKPYFDYIENQLKISIYNQSILSEEAKAAMQLLSPGRMLTSTICLAGNFVGGMREIMEATWKSVGMAFSKKYGGKDQFTYSDYAKALDIVLKDGPDFMHNVTMIEALNARFKIANMDMNVFAERLNSNRSGILSMNDKIFWFQTAPDYFNRMVIVISKMIHDGCFDAMSFDGKELKYDWKKDKRFAVYASGQKTHPKYAEQRGLYLSLLAEESRTKGVELKEGSKLDSPYFKEEILAIKNFSDTVFGYYDHDLRMHWEKTFIGSIMMHFRTYLSSTRTHYFQKQGFYNLGNKKQKIDEKTGKPVFWKDVVLPTGEEARIPTLEDTGSPLIEVTNSYMEGIFWTFVEAYQTFKGEPSIAGLRQAVSDISNSDVKMQNMKKFSYDLMIAILVGGIGRYLISLWSDYRDEQKSGSSMSMTQAANDQAFYMFTKSFLGSTQDFNIFNALTSPITDEPASVGIMSRLFTSTNQFLFGDRTLESYLKTNLGVYRAGQGLYDGIAEMAREANQ